uniref:C-type lectin domain-containing protein n=1 Tax=Heligmosomoides polygyrus TaxID=6339 RepID=A0A8L8KRI3_HELPZ
LKKLKPGKATGPSTCNQCGFVAGCGTVDSIYGAQILIEKHREKQEPVQIAFLNLEKEFDRIPREVIWNPTTNISQMHSADRPDESFLFWFFPDSWTVSSVVLYGARNIEIPDDQWSSGYPMNMCADTPRITAVMTPYGYRDMTAIARLPLICTFGKISSVKKITVEETGAALKKMKPGKAAGPDDVAADLGTMRCWYTAKWLTKFFNQVVEENKKGVFAILSSTPPTNVVTWRTVAPPMPYMVLVFW